MPYEPLPFRWIGLHLDRQASFCEEPVEISGPVKVKRLKAEGRSIGQIQWNSKRRSRVHEGDVKTKFEKEISHHSSTHETNNRPSSALAS
ncbi:hypothetical protein Tco_1437475 [Tanacetum coccineum]